MRIKSVSEIPYQVNKSALIEKIAFLAQQKKIGAYPRYPRRKRPHGIRIVVELARGPSRAWC